MLASQLASCRPAVQAATGSLNSGVPVLLHKCSPENVDTCACVRARISGCLCHPLSIRSETLQVPRNSAPIGGLLLDSAPQQGVSLADTTRCCQSLQLVFQESFHCASLQRTRLWWHILPHCNLSALSCPLIWQGRSHTAVTTLCVCLRQFLWNRFTGQHFRLEWFHSAFKGGLGGW